MIPAPSVPSSPTKVLEQLFLPPQSSFSSARLPLMRVACFKQCHRAHSPICERLSSLWCHLVYWYTRPHPKKFRCQINDKTEIHLFVVVNLCSKQDFNRTCWAGGNTWWVQTWDCLETQHEMALSSNLYIGILATLHGMVDPEVRQLCSWLWRLWRQFLSILYLLCIWIVRGLAVCCVKQIR